MCGILIYHNGHKLQGCDTFLDFEGLEENIGEKCTNQTKMVWGASIVFFIQRNLKVWCYTKEVQTTQVLKR